jgi:predicted DNA-binding transcriptional regulator AlpA
MHSVSTPDRSATVPDKPANPRKAIAQPLEAAATPDALLKLRTAAAISGLSEATLYRKSASDPTFPRLVKMGKRCTRIRAGDLTAWLSAQAAGA